MYGTDTNLTAARCAVMGICLGFLCIDLCFDLLVLSDKTWLVSCPICLRNGNRIPVTDVLWI